MKILFCSRGRGHGHAIPDIAIGAKFIERNPSVGIEFVSYSTGAETFRNAGVPVSDLQVPDNMPFLAMQEKFLAEMCRLEPDVVFAHEEFAAVAACAIQKIPCIFISAWLPSPGSLAAEAVLRADCVILLGEPGIFPLGLQCTNIVYAGNVLRPMKHSIGERLILRAEHGVPENAACILMLPGGGDAVAGFAVTDLVVQAFRLISQEKRLVWAGKHVVETSARYRDEHDVVWSDFVDPIERLFVCADVIISKGTRGVTLDAASVGVPSISISSGNNPVDDLLVPRIPTNVSLYFSATSPEILSFWIMRCLAPAHRAWTTSFPSRKSDGLQSVVAALERFVNRWAGRSSGIGQSP